MSRWNVAMFSIREKAGESLKQISYCPLSTSSPKWIPGIVSLWKHTPVFHFSDPADRGPAS